MYIYFKIGFYFKLYSWHTSIFSIFMQNVTKSYINLLFSLHKWVLQLPTLQNCEKKLQKSNILRMIWDEIFKQITFKSTVSLYMTMWKLKIWDALKFENCCTYYEHFTRQWYTCLFYGWFMPRDVTFKERHFNCCSQKVAHRGLKNLFHNVKFIQYQRNY